MTQTNNNDYNQLLEFIISQVLVILYSSKASISMIKWSENYNEVINKMTTSPNVALYEKALNDNYQLRMVSSNTKPSLETTGASIQVLSKLYKILSNFNKEKGYSDFINEIKEIAILQLHYCLEYLRDKNVSLKGLSSVLSGSSQLLSIDKKSLCKSYHVELFEEITNIYNKTLSEIDIPNTSTLDLAYVANAFIDKNYLYNYNKVDIDTLLIPLILEISSRISVGGIFTNGQNNHMSLPLGQQFYILGTLIYSFGFIQLENIIEIAYEVFNVLIKYLYNRKNKKHSFTTLDISYIINCLSHFSKIPDLPNEYSKYIQEIISDILNIIQKTNATQSALIKLQLELYIYSHKNNINVKHSPFYIFPNKIDLNNVKLNKEPFFINKGIDSNNKIRNNRLCTVNQKSILYLCSALLSLDVFNMAQDDYNISKEDNSILKIVKLLFELLNN